MNAKLLIIEDDLEFADYLRRGLSYEGYQVQTATSAEAGLGLLHLRQPDMVILDVMLPGMDGMAACSRLRQSGYSGSLLMLTARNSIHDRINGLDAGADDYLSKPFAFDELLARLRALLRRQGRVASLITFADLELDTNLHLARRQHQTIPLSHTEYALLSLFLTYPGQVLTREALLENVWPGEADKRTNVLDVYVSRLRRKLGEPTLFHTVHGVGYILKDEVT